MPHASCNRRHEVDPRVPGVEPTGEPPVVPNWGFAERRPQLLCVCQPILALLLLFVFLTPLSPAALAQPAVQPPPVEENIGIEGTYMFRYNGPVLEPLPVDHRSSMFVRIADVLDDDGSTLYELRFTGMRPGEYDLRESLRHVDGQPHEDLPSMPVRIVGLLPEDHSGDLEELAASPLPNPWPYRIAVAALIAVWTVPLVWSIVRRVSARPERPQVKDEPRLTLADQLRPLVDAAIAGNLDKEGKARLELLLLAHWRERLRLVGYDGHAAITRMKQDPAAGELLRRLENWLHRRPGTVEIDVEELLSPYRDAPAVST